MHVGCLSADKDRATMLCCDDDRLVSGVTPGEREVQRDET